MMPQSNLTSWDVGIIIQFSEGKLRLHEVEKLVQGAMVLGGRRKIGTHMCWAPKLRLFEVSTF